MQKSLSILVVVLSLAGATWADLVGYWPLDGDATDASGNGHDGVLSGNVTPTTDRLGNPAGAMWFAGGSGDAIHVGDAPEFQVTGAMTVTAWVYLDGSSPVHGARNGRILAKMAGSTSRSWSAGIEAEVDGIPFRATFQVSSDGHDVVGLLGPTLPVDEWVHYAGVYAPGESMTVYLDGEPVAVRTAGVPAHQYADNGYPVLIGHRPACSNCGWYGALDEVRLYDEALSQQQIQAIMGVFRAVAPDPPDGALHVDPKGILQWKGAESAIYDVYLGTDPDFSGQSPVSAGQSETSYDPDPDLDYATAYYWRVDVKDAKNGEVYEGTTWSFTTQGLASDPVPDDGAIRVDPEVTLAWTGDEAAGSHDVYLSTRPDAVVSARHPAGDLDHQGPVGVPDLRIFCGQWLSIPGPIVPNANLDGMGPVDLKDFSLLASDWLGPFQGNQTSTTFAPGPLAASTTYYWRVDGVNESEPTSPWKGDVWSFTTRPKATLWEYEEWSVENPSWDGDPFDVVATVTFVHQATGRTHTTEMFYDGGTTWKFRFTATLTGEWRFTSTSTDPELDGLTGRLVILPNPDPLATGFLTHRGNKYAIQTGNSGELKAFRFNVYMNGQDFPAFIHNLTSAETINAYLDDARQYGFDTVFVHVCNNWFDFGSIRWDEHDSRNPDPETFAALERLIAIARSRHMRVQIWAWGDEARRWTPIGVGGINGVPDRRLQRYIAARLGPLPGWTMGYGFDLQEWVNESQVGAWAEYLHQHFGWRHLVWGRGRSHSELDVISYSGSSDNGKPFSYTDALNKLNSDLARPHLYEERFSYMRDGAWTMDNTRRAIWHYTLAGGMGSWWGFYRLGVAGSPLPPYPNPEQLATVNRFWQDRFLLDMEPANELTNGFCLKATEGDKYVFYKEDTGSIRMDLSDAASPLPAVAVDTKSDYAEINVGTLSPTSQTWTAPYVSDWAIAVGDFD